MTGSHAQTLSTYGTPGLLETPTAEILEDGILAFTAARMDKNLRTTMTFQMLPGVHGSFRYAVIDGFDGGGTINRYDRSFDLHFLLREEGQRRPALALGFRDFGGIGVFASEYLTATKTFRDGVQSWLSADSATLTLKQSFRISSKGFGAGLAGFGLDQSAALVLAARAGTAKLFHSFLNGNDQVVQRAYQCEIAILGAETISLGDQPIAARKLEEH